MQQCTEPTPEVLAKWLPALSRLPPVAEPRLRIVCFHSAGCAEDMYSSEGTGLRRAPSPLLEWCRRSCAEVLAVQAPGRGMRQREPPCTSAQDMASQVLQVLETRLQRPARGAPVPWVIISHSMGCWVAFELLRLAKGKGAPLPTAWFVSAMPAPDIPEADRPWRQQRNLGEEEFKAECRAWDINDVVFSPGMWPTYEPMLRADFRIFDEYKFQPLHQGGQEGEDPLLKFEQLTVEAAGSDEQGELAGSGQPGNGTAGSAARQSEGDEGEQLSFPIHAYWGTKDRRVTQQMVEEWRRFTTGPFSCSKVDGNHLWPLHKEAKAAWLDKVVEELSQLHV